ncbi:MAG: Hint domain-containing protein [bacterium]
MPTNYVDQFYIFDPYLPPSPGSTLTVSALTITDSNNNGVLRASDSARVGHSRVYDQINGSNITAVWNGDTVTVMHNDGTIENITGVTFYTTDGHAYFSPLSASHLSNATLVGTSWTPINSQVTIAAMGPPCFVAGTRIRTPTGWSLVEDLLPGDLVMTLDNGAKPLAWVGQRTVPGYGRFAPIRFCKGVLGNQRPVLVSPQHRILLRGVRAEVYLGTPEVLVAAKHLVNDSTVEVRPCREVTYCHFMFDQHEIVRAEGMLAESFHPGATILNGDEALRQELTELFPDLADAATPHWQVARPVIKAHEARVLLAA